MAAVGVASLLLNVLLHQPKGWARMAEDWRRLQVSRTLDPAGPPSEAFNTLYAHDIAPDAHPRQIRDWYAREMRADRPLVIDAVLAKYIHARAGQIDGRSLPPGIYVGAGPIGPDIWPMPVLSHYFFFPHHGYVLVVPFAEGGAWPEAVEVTASVDRDFKRAGTPAGDLFAAQHPYDPGAFDFPRPAVPIHDLFLVTNDPEEVRRTTRRLDGAVRRLSAAELPYLLFRRNSNSALGCFLRVSGVGREALDRLGSDPMVRLRLPGIAQDLWRRPQRGAPPECVSRQGARN